MHNTVFINVSLGTCFFFFNVKRSLLTSLYKIDVCHNTVLIVLSFTNTEIYGVYNYIKSYRIQIKNLKIDRLTFLIIPICVCYNNNNNYHFCASSAATVVDLCRQ